MFFFRKNSFKMIFFGKKQFLDDLFQEKMLFNVYFVCPDFFAYAFLRLPPYMYIRVISHHNIQKNVCSAFCINRRQKQNEYKRIVSRGMKEKLRMGGGRRPPFCTPMIAITSDIVLLTYVLFSKSPPSPNPLMRRMVLFRRGAKSR